MPQDSSPQSRPSSPLRELLCTRDSRLKLELNSHRARSGDRHEGPRSYPRGLSAYRGFRFVAGWAMSTPIGVGIPLRLTFLLAIRKARSRSGSAKKCKFERLARRPARFFAARSNYRAAPRNDAEGSSPNRIRYSRAKRPSSEKPYSAAMRVTVVLDGSAVLRA